MIERIVKLESVLPTIQEDLKEIKTSLQTLTDQQKNHQSHIDQAKGLKSGVVYLLGIVATVASLVGGLIGWITSK